jgi:anthranilate synthase component 2
MILPVPQPIEQIAYSPVSSHHDLLDLTPIKVLLFDCHDSFTHNLAQVIAEMLPSNSYLEVVSCDQLNFQLLQKFNRLILSPGPGVPGETPNLYLLIDQLAGSIPILGVCLGHQALAQRFGATLINLPQVYHGIQSKISSTAPCPLFTGLPPVFTAGRYHSWLVADENLPQELVVTARDELGQIMGIKHHSLPIYGVQFHPESILTPYGPQIIGNFLFGF